MKTRHFDEIPGEKPPFPRGASPPVVRRSRVFRRSAFANSGNAREVAGNPRPGPQPPRPTGRWSGVISGRCAFWSRTNSVPIERRGRGSVANSVPTERRDRRGVANSVPIEWWDRRSAANSVPIEWRDRRSAANSARIGRQGWRSVANSVPIERRDRRSVANSVRVGR